MPEPENNQSNIQKFKADDILAGKYQIVKFINRGSAGMVYQARHIMLDKVFAIKMLSPDEITSDTSSERFQREAHATSSLSHPNIITVHDFGILPEGTLYLAMEYLEGETLATLLERQEHLDFKQAIPIFMQICLALEYAHAQGIIHRDLKPSNIMLIKDHQGELLAKVIDFSIAKFTRPKPDQKTITKPGQIFGTPLYMSPEQCQGKKPDHRSDIYSLGCVMYEVLCGAPPLLGDSSLNTIYKHVNDLPLPFSQIKDINIPKELEAIIFKALAKEPENRYQSANELRAALHHFEQTYSPESVQPTSLAQNSHRFFILTKAFNLFLLLILACFVIALCLFLNTKLVH
jgi:eukaryotic-like serine/threonine-protein kinase